MKRRRSTSQPTPPPLTCTGDAVTDYTWTRGDTLTRPKDGVFRLQINCELQVDWLLLCLQQLYGRVMVSPLPCTGMYVRDPEAMQQSA